MISKESLYTKFRVQNDTTFLLTDKCQHAFETLKKHLTVAPIVQPSQGDLSFEIITDASDFTLGAILGQRVDNKHSVILLCKSYFK